MSDESETKDKTFEFPMMPIFGVDLGERLGEFAAGQRQMEARLDRLETRIDALDAKTDKMAYALNRLDERTKHLESKFNLSIGLSGAILAAVIAGIVLQFFFK